MRVSSCDLFFCIPDVTAKCKTLDTYAKFSDSTSLCTNNHLLGNSISSWPWLEHEYVLPTINGVLLVLLLKNARKLLVDTCYIKTACLNDVSLWNDRKMWWESAWLNKFCWCWWSKEYRACVILACFLLQAVIVQSEADSRNFMEVSRVLHLAVKYIYAFFFHQERHPAWTATHPPFN